MKVLISGAGPAGLTAAYWLKRYGFNPTIVERAPSLLVGGYKIDVRGAALQVISQMGIHDAVVAARTDMQGAQLVDKEGNVLERMSGDEFGHRVTGDLEIVRGTLCQILRDHLGEVEILFGDTIQGITQSSDSAQVQFTKNGVREFDCVIGADGLRSVIGRRLNLVRPSRWPKRIALVAHYSGVAESREFGEMYVDRGGYCGVADVGNGLTNVAVVVPVSRAAEIAVDRTEFLESWIAERPQIAERFRGAVRATPVRATGPFATSARRAWVRGAALVGDAAEFFDPFTGEGIYTALRGGEMLANLVSNALRSHRDTESALREYERARRREFSGKWLVEKIVGAAVSSPKLINRAARVLSRRRDMADLLVGVVGDFVPAREVLKPGYLLRLLFSPARSA